tara:strand:+ start:704 stop:1384 length:681 start_codon:yes stop_codon:yes gene_type:complete
MAIFYGLAESEKEVLSQYPGRIENMEQAGNAFDEIEKELDSIDTGGFFSKYKRWNKNRKMNKFHKTKLFYGGALGENQVIKKLEELSDEYHVICGANIRLPYWVTYRNKKNLRSAQMDVIVVSKRGAYLIEVKNWSGGFSVKDAKFNPYEQTERAGRVLWIYLQSIRKGTNVKNVLLSVKGDFEYNYNYKSVYVSNLQKIKNLLETGYVQLTDEEVTSIVEQLRKL